MTQSPRRDVRWAMARALMIATILAIFAATGCAGASKGLRIAFAVTALLQLEVANLYRTSRKAVAGPPGPPGPVGPMGIAGLPGRDARG